jgi:hypothetical protein
MQMRDLFRVLVIGCLLVLAVSGVVYAAGQGKGHGILTSIEDDGSVIIKDNKGQLNGYLLSPAVTVQDGRGARKSLRSLHLPVDVYFEYEYMKKGFMIVLIKEDAK